MLKLKITKQLISNIYYMKKCKVCNIEKEVNDFPKNSGKCKICYNEYMRNYYNNRTEYKEQKKKYTKVYQKENADKIAKYQKEYKIINKEELNEYKKTYFKEYNKRENRKEYNKEYNKKYRSDNKEKIKEYVRDNRAITRQNKII